MRIPANIIKYNYTSGNEYAYVSNYKYYQGYYYELNNKFFAGKEFNTNSLELIKTTSNNNINTLLTQASTYVYGLISKKSSQQLSSPKFNSLSKSDLDTDQELIETYYAKKININPIIIKQIDKKTFEELKKDLFYQITSLKPDRSNLEEAEKQMPGLKAFLES
jgi:hypothetical protein